jgi:pre-mRNA branch site protein p14
LTVLYYQPNKLTKKMDLEKKRAELEALKARHGVDGSTPLPQKRATA